MAKFYTSRNNGVLAVIREDDAQLWGLITKAGGDPIKAGVRIFTFCDAKRLEEDPDQRRIFTGSFQYLTVLGLGHIFAPCEDQPREMDGWGGFVPFSNQDYEDMRYCTTAEDVTSKFELIRYPSD